MHRSAVFYARFDVQNGAFLRKVRRFSTFYGVFLRRNEGDTRLNYAVFWRGWLAIEKLRILRRHAQKSAAFYAAIKPFKSARKKRRFEHQTARKIRRFCAHHNAVKYGVSLVC